MTAGESAASLAALASRLVREKRLPEAIAALERLAALQPDQPDLWYDLACLQRSVRRFEPAIASFGRALELGIASPEEVHVNRSVLFDHLERQREAEAELSAALALRPDFVPALMNLGIFQEDRGDRAAARATYERVLAAEPGNMLALARLAGASEVAGRDDPLLGRLRAAAARRDASHQDLAGVGFALGHALDAAGAYDEAFAAFAAANRANQASAGLHYDRAAHSAFVDRLIAAFPAPAAAAAAGDGVPPLFICGMFRSGSTLVEQILAAHSRVTPGGELDLLPSLVRTISPYPAAAAAATPEQVARWRNDYLEGLRAIHPGAGLVTDKRPDNFLHVGLIKTLFPGARIVHTARDALDNCLSVWFLHLNPRMSYAHRLADIAHWYREYRRLMAHWKALYPNDIYDVGYDALVADPEPIVRGLLDFCGLGWEQGCLDFHAAAGIVKTASLWQVRQPLYRRSSGRWRNYERHLAELRAALGG